jgi:hypothetical protein
MLSQGDSFDLIERLPAKQKGTTGARVRFHTKAQRRTTKAQENRVAACVISLLLV